MSVELAGLVPRFSARGQRGYQPCVLAEQHACIGTHDHDDHNGGDDDNIIIDVIIIIIKC